MTQQYNFLYKCRRCGKIDTTRCAGEKIIAIAMLMDAANGIVSGAFSPRLHAIHPCGDGFGITDLIGAEPEGESDANI